MKILICGVGAIGSNLTARIASDLKQCDITVLDKDVVEERNTTAGTQFYMPNQVGLPKVEALQFNIYKWYQREINIIREDFNGTIENWDQYDLTIDCFDNSQARKDIQLFYEIAKDLNKKRNILHIGFSDQFTFAIEWADHYKVPSDITSGMDICEMQGASAFVNKVASIGALVTEEFVFHNKKIEFVGSKFSYQVIK